MTWKQLAMKVVAEIDSNSLDLNAQPFHLKSVNIGPDDKDVVVRITVDRRANSSPKSCSLDIQGVQ
jgi:hypothetical protein